MLIVVINKKYNLNCNVCVLKGNLLFFEVICFVEYNYLLKGYFNYVLNYFGWIKIFICIIVDLKFSLLYF